MKLGLKSCISVLASFALTVSAWAGTGSLTVTPGTGVTYQVGTLAGGNYFGLYALCDGSACAQIQAVKAASTAAVATDPSAVVQLSPNSPQIGTAGTASAEVFTVQGIASMTPLLATLSGTNNINNISGTISLPTGAATAANQTNVQGTAGSPATTVLSVQGVASGTAVPVSGTVSITGVATAANQTSVQGTVGAGTAPADMNVGGCLYNSSLPGPTSGQSVATQCDSSGRALVDVGAGTVAATQSGTWNINNVSGTVSLPTGAATAANQEVTAAGSSASSAQAVQGVTGGVAVPVSGTFWQTTQPVSISGNQAVNLAQVAGATTSTGAGATGTGSQRVGVAQDTTTIAGSAPGTAGTPSTNVVSVQGVSSGTVIPVSGTVSITGVATAANQTSVQGTVGAGTAPADMNVSGCLYNSSAPTPTNGQSLATQCDASGRAIVDVGAGTVAATQSGTWNVTNVSGTVSWAFADEGTFTQGTTVQTPVGGFYNTSPANLSSGQGGAVQMTADRSIKTVGGLTTSTLTGWTSGTSLNATQSLLTNGNTGAPAILLQLDQTSTISGGVITIQGTYDGTNWITLPAADVVNPTSASLAQASNPYTLAASTNQPFLIFTSGFQGVRINLTTQISGTATVTPYVTLLPSQTAEQQYLALLYSGVTSAIPAGSNNIGSVNILGHAGGTLDGTAGSAASAVLTVQGIGSMTPILANPGTIATWGLATVGAGTAPTNAMVGGSVYNSSAPSPTSGQSLALQSDSSGNLKVDVAAGTVAATQSGSWTVNPATAASWGVGATGSATPANGVTQGVDAQSAEPSKATTGNLTPMFGDLTGKVVTSPYANRENMVRGSASATGTGATTLIAAGGASVKTYITDVECGRTDAGTTASYVTLSDGASTILILPNNGGGGGNSKTFNVPLVTAANTAFTFTSSASLSTVYCSAQGFSGY